MRTVKIYALGAAPLGETVLRVTTSRDLSVL